MKRCVTGRTDAEHSVCPTSGLRFLSKPGRSHSGGAVRIAPQLDNFAVSARREICYAGDFLTYGPAIRGWASGVVRVGRPAVCRRLCARHGLSLSLGFHRRFSSLALPPRPRHPLSLRRNLLALHRPPHLPLVAALQVACSRRALHWSIKWPIILAVALTVLLLS